MSFYLTNSRIIHSYPTTAQKESRLPGMRQFYRLQRELVLRLVEDASAAVCAAARCRSLTELRRGSKLRQQTPRLLQERSGARGAKRQRSRRRHASFSPL